jgi:hypothetical protein
VGYDVVDKYLVGLLLPREFHAPFRPWGVADTKLRYSTPVLTLVVPTGPRPHHPIPLVVPDRTNDEPQTRPLLRQSTFPGSETHQISILTANINSLKANGHKLVETLLSKHTVVALQETKLANQFQTNTFRFHLDHVVGKGSYLLAINDHRHDTIGTEAHRSSGVILFFHASMPGFAELHRDSHLDIPDKYMVVSTRWADTPVYFHNVYAPIPNGAREAVFASLPRDFPDNAKHFVMGDFNVPMDRLLDSMGTLPTMADPVSNDACELSLLLSPKRQPPHLGMLLPWILRGGESTSLLLWLPVRAANMGYTQSCVVLLWERVPVGYDHKYRSPVNHTFLGFTFPCDHSVVGTFGLSHSTGSMDHTQPYKIPS